MIIIIIIIISIIITITLTITITITIIIIIIIIIIIMKTVMPKAAFGKKQIQPPPPPQKFSSSYEDSHAKHTVWDCHLSGSVVLEFSAGGG
eukprot:5988161-Amphidinium_carterae.1